MDCTSSALIGGAHRYCCFPRGKERAAEIYLLCQWANNLNPCVPPVIDWLGPLTDIVGGFHGDFLVTTPPTLDIIVYWGLVDGGPYPNTVTLAPNATGFDVLTVIPPLTNVFAIFVARNSPTCITTSDENTDAAASIVIIDDGTGTFWRLVVDVNGNVGATSDPGPATPDVVLDDGVTHWQIKVDTSGLRYADSTLAAATAAPAIDDGTGTLWILQVDTNGNIYATS